MVYVYPAWEFAADSHPFEIAALARQGSPHCWNVSKALTEPRVACGFQNSVRMTLL